MRSESVTYCYNCTYYLDARNTMRTWAKCSNPKLNTSDHIFIRVIDTMTLAKCKLLRLRQEDKNRWSS